MILSPPILKYFRQQCAAFGMDAGRKSSAFASHVSPRPSGRRIPRLVAMQ
jgi:hypothetical protein